MILIDSNSICHMAKHSMDSLSWEEKKVGVIFGFLRQLLSLSKTFGSNQFVFVWDSKKSIRTQMFPDYKKSRKQVKTEEEKEFNQLAYDQFNIIKDTILPELGFINNFMCDGFEADDLIAKITQKYLDEEIVIVSTDEDLYQLLSANITMYSIRKKKSYTAINLWKDYKIIPSEWGEAKAIAGCSTDCVPGVPHVGEATACKYITRKLPHLHKTYKAILGAKELIEHNRKLVILPLEGTPDIEINANEKLNIRKFIDISTRYGFQSFLNKDTLQQWKEHIFKENIMRRIV